MNKFYIFFLIIALTVFSSACWSATEETKVSPTNAVESNKDSADDKESKVGDEKGITEAKTAGDESEMDAKKLNSSLSPTEILKAYDDASNAKEPEKVKNFISKGSVILMEKRAKEEGVSFDKLIRDGKGIPAIEADETRNQNISGDTATVEIKFAEMENFDNVPFVKEDGVWKIDFVKFLDDMKKKINN